jgi:uncharacterized protein
MVNSTFLLFQVQKSDIDKLDIETSINAILAEIDNRSMLDEMEENILLLSNNLQNYQLGFDDLGQRISDFHIKVNQLTSSLYSGKIQNSKELQEIQTEIESLKKKIISLEDDQMKKWEDLEKTQDQLKISELNLTSIQEKKISENILLEGKLNKLKNDLKRLDIENKAIRNQISSTFLEIYDRLFKTKKGVAIAQITENCCEYCGTTLTPSDCQHAKVHSVLTFCSNCGRILYAG